MRKKEIEKKIGRKKVNDPTASRTCSIRASVEKKARNHFKNLGEAIAFAVEIKEHSKIK